MVIDFHTHCFPDKLAARAVERLAFASGGLEPFTDGTVAGLRRAMAAGGVSRAVVLNIATNAHQQASVNDFARAIHNGGDIIAFGSVYPDAPDALQELERIKAMGLRGVKLHPEYQGFRVDDEKMRPIYRKISQLGLITVFHAGADYAFPPPYGASPERLERALDWFDSPVVAAHWGGIGSSQGVLDRLCGRENLWLDTSYGYSMLPKDHARQILDRHGVERILFATDTPWHSANMEWRLLDSLGLTPAQREAIACKNALRLLGE